jgi:HlyD family secretion protein
MNFSRYMAFGWLLILSGCGTSEKEAAPVVTVQTAPAERTNVSQFVSAEAVVFPIRQAIVSPKITSTIAEFKVQRGSRVKRGQLLAILENRDLAAQAEASKGDFEQADANYAIAVHAALPQQLQKAELDAAAAKSAFEAAQKVFESRQTLYQQGAIPRRDLDSADVALAQARSQNEQAQKQLVDLQRMGKEQLYKAATGTKESAEGHYRAAVAQLSYSEIRSPIDGVITDRPLYVGDLATANQPILTVMDISHLLAKAHVPETDAAQLKVGDPAQIKTPDQDEPVEGSVTLVSPALDTGSTTIEVWIETKKSTPALKPGMTVSIEITAKTARDAISVPSSAVFSNPDGTSYVLVAGADKKAHQQTIQMGVRNQERTQIVKGISANDLVIVSGGYALADGTAIEIEKPTDEKDQTKQPEGEAEKGKE